MTEAQLIHEGWALWDSELILPRWCDIFWLDNETMRRMTGVHDMTKVLCYNVTGAA